MPLLTTSTKTNARMVELGQNIAAHLAASASSANEQARAALALSDADLTEWLNAQGAELLDLLTAHGVMGQAINTASSTTVATLAASGVSAPTGIVDIRPFTDKLADQGRVLTVNQDGTVTVSTPPPPPEPEPEPEPEPTPEP